jgi:hypothetical protein
MSVKQMSSSECNKWGIDFSTPKVL